VQRALVDHMARLPGVQVECEDILSSFQSEALLRRTIDIGFLRPPVASEELQSEFLFRENMVVLLSSSHPLASKKRLKLKNLAHEPLLLHDRNASIGMHDQVLELYRQAGIEPQVRYMKSGHCDEARLALVAAGKGIYVGTGVVVNREIYGNVVTTIPLDEPGATVDVLMAWRKNEQSATTLGLIDSARKVFRTVH
jgi:DNA-binding transcriptional LysR family regulator